MADKALLKLIQQQQDQIKQNQEQTAKLFSSITEQLCKLTDEKESADSDPRIKETLANGIQVFAYDPDNGVTFDSWYRRYEDLFLVDAVKLDEKAKVRLLMQKLGVVEHTQYCNYILPSHPREFSLRDTIEKLSAIFGERTSLFNIRYNCINLVRNMGDDIVTYAGKVNHECERFKLSDLSSSQFKSLIFVAGLTSPEDADIRTRLLSKLDTSPDLTIQELTSEYLRLVNLKRDSQLVQSSHKSNDIASVDRILRQDTKRFSKHDEPSRGLHPPSACWYCGQWHFGRFCPFRNHVCQNCQRVGHKESHCRQKLNSGRSRHQSNIVFSADGGSLNRRRKYITLYIDSHPVTLQIDTASDITIISRNTWISLGQPPYQSTKRIAKNASGDPIPFLGELTCDFSFHGYSEKGICYISTSDHLNLLGIEWIERLNLWDVPLSSVCDQFDKFECCPIDFVCRVSPDNFHDSTALRRHYETKFPDVFSEGLGLCKKQRLFCTRTPMPVLFFVQRDQYHIHLSKQ